MKINLKFNLIKINNNSTLSYNLELKVTVK